MYNPKDMFLIPNLKGIAMLGVLLVHTSIWSEYVRSLVELFAMPIFAFFAGYCIKKSPSFDFSYIRRIISIYLTANIFYFVASLPLYFSEINWLKIAEYMLYPNVVPLWFLVSMVLWYLIYKIFSPISAQTFSLFLVLSVLAFTFRQSNDPVGIIYRTFRFFPFYLIGTMLDSSKFYAIREAKIKNLLLPLFVAVCAVSSCYMNFHVVDNVFASLVVLLLSLACVYSLLVITQGSRVALLSKTGFNSLLIYVCGFFFQRVFNEFIVKYNVRENFGYGVVVLANIVVIFIVLLFLNRDFFIRTYNKFILKFESIIFLNRGK